MRVPSNPPTVGSTWNASESISPLSDCSDTADLNLFYQRYHALLAMELCYLLDSRHVDDALSPERNTDQQGL